jgi:protocatechuate 3,4-dioxygenase alpha subunit
VLPWLDEARLAPPEHADAVRLHGQVLDGNGEPVPDALIEIWHPGRPGFGRCPTDSGGRFDFTALKPDPDPPQAPHLAVSVFARGLLRRLITRVYFPDEPDANAADPVLRLVDDPEALVAVEDDDGLHFDIRLQGERETPFFAL